MQAIAEASKAYLDGDTNDIEYWDKLSQILESNPELVIGIAHKLAETEH